MTQQSTNSLSLYGFLRPRPEFADEVRRTLSALVGPTRSEPGNLAYHLHEQEDGRFFLYEVWRSREDRHNALPALRAFLGNLPTFLEGPPEVYADTMISPYADSAESAPLGTVPV
ncbi:putative quinol monooxygenase [Streptomyces sp. DT225]